MVSMHHLLRLIYHRFDHYSSDFLSLRLAQKLQNLFRRLVS